MAAKQLDGHPGDRIGDLRTNLGMTKKELSQKTGIDASQITRIENGPSNYQQRLFDKAGKGIENIYGLYLGPYPCQRPQKLRYFRIGSVE